jgi:hypothetical protein
MAKGKPPKDKQYKGQRKNDFVFFFVVFPLAFILFVLWWFSFGHYIVCLFLVFPLTIILCPFVVFFWPLCCLSYGGFPLAFILFVFFLFFL